jgi:tetratricopeptide (TPR) repeat protein
MMRRRSRLAPLAFVALSIAVGGCQQFKALKAKQNFKDANALYTAGEYKRAAAKYEEALELDPNLTEAYFYLGNSYDNQYKPGKQGEAENDALLHKAVTNYKVAAERSTDPKMKKLSLEYLVAAYAPDKLNDPSQAEPIVQRMIELDPSDPTNYFGLAKLYEDAGRYEEAEQALIKAKEVRPNDPTVYTQLAGFYNRQGEFEKTIGALEERAAKEPNNPEAFYTIATYYWDKAFRDFRLKEAQKREYVLKGIEATNRALALKPDYMEALTYKNILLRMQANTEKDPAKQKALIAEADQLRNKAIEIQKKQKGIGGT